MPVHINAKDPIIAFGDGTGHIVIKQHSTGNPKVVGERKFLGEIRMTPVEFLEIWAHRKMLLRDAPHSLPRDYYEAL